MFSQIQRTPRILSFRSLLLSSFRSEHIVCTWHHSQSSLEDVTDWLLRHHIFFVLFGSYKMILYIEKYGPRTRLYLMSFCNYCIVPGSLDVCLCHDSIIVTLLEVQYEKEGDTIPSCASLSAPDGFSYFSPTSCAYLRPTFHFSSTSPSATSCFSVPALKWKSLLPLSGGSPCSSHPSSYGYVTNWTVLFRK